jgi:drug/metabolite transporter (DMT)-like permease
MTEGSSVTGSLTVTRAPRVPPGLALGALGILGFSFSLPATKLAVADLDPWFVAFGRAVVAGLLALAVLRLGRAPRPAAAHWRRLALVAGGVVVGFPLLTSLALRELPAAHAIVTIGLLPAATAVAAVLRAGERPALAFWLAAGAGTAAVVAFAVAGGASGLATADLWLLGAVAVCGVGYAEGAVVARELGGARTICWALVLALPLTVPVAALSANGLEAGTEAWLGFAYVALVSMFLGFFAWYAGLARGGVARIGQVQLAQPVLSLGWAALVLGEAVSGAEAITAAGVLACVVATQRARA